MTVKRHRKRFATTFEPKFITYMKMEALKREMPVSKLIELAVKEYLEKEEE